MVRMGPLIAAALLAWPAAARAATPVEAFVRYQVKAGDTLYGLAAQYLLRSSDSRTVQRLNHIATPRRLPVGRVLNIPADLLRSEPIVARLAAYSGPVTVRGGNAGPLRLEMPLTENAELTTGANAFLTFELPDASRVTLPSQSRVRLARLRRILLTGAIQRDIQLIEGRAQSTVTPMPNPASRFRILTPVAVSAVRGTEFRVRHEPAAERSTVEVLEGRVGEAALASTAEGDVSAGFGAAVSEGAVTPPAKLLPAPGLASPARLQDEPQVTFMLKPVAGAAAHRAQIARDAGFIDLIAEATAAEPRLAFADLGNGTFFVRITELDASGLEGLPATYAFERRLNALGLDAPLAVPGARRQYLFKWRSTGGAPETFRFMLSRRPDGREAVIDVPGLSDRQMVITDLPAGTYYWRVLVSRREDGRLFDKWSPAQRFEIGR